MFSNGYDISFHNLGLPAYVCSKWLFSWKGSPLERMNTLTLIWPAPSLNQHSICRELGLGGVVYIIGLIACQNPSNAKRSKIIVLMFERVECQQNPTLISGFFLRSMSQAQAGTLINCCFFCRLLLWLAGIGITWCSWMFPLSWIVTLFISHQQSKYLAGHNSQKKIRVFLLC